MTLRADADVTGATAGVTVVVANFNGRSVLAETIRSIYAQDYPFLRQVIVADDASTDDSVAVPLIPAR